MFNSLTSIYVHEEPRKACYQYFVYKFRRSAAPLSNGRGHRVVMQHGQNSRVPDMTPLHDKASGDAALSPIQIGPAAWLIHAVFISTAGGSKQTACGHRHRFAAANHQVIEYPYTDQLQGIA